MSVPASQLKTITAISKPDCEHIAERHGPGGSGDALFDQNFLDANGGYGGIAKSVFETGASSVEFDNSRRLIYRYYKNFNTKTGVGKDKEGGM